VIVHIHSLFVPAIVGLTKVKGFSNPHGNMHPCGTSTTSPGCIFAVRILRRWFYWQSLDQDQQGYGLFAGNSYVWSPRFRPARSPSNDRYAISWQRTPGSHPCLCIFLHP
jgi:hypothetical protein